MTMNTMVVSPTFIMIEPLVLGINKMTEPLVLGNDKMIEPLVLGINKMTKMPNKRD